MRTRRKPVKRRFLALFLCLSMVISMMNVGGYNVWADENPVVDETGGSSEEKPPERNKEVNPEYTIQHYFWFPQVEMGKEGTTNEEKEKQLSVINTDGVGVPTSPQEARDRLTSVTMTSKENGRVVTEDVLTRMFMDEKTEFLKKPRMMYMNRLYNTISEQQYNKNYTLEEVWVRQPQEGKPVPDNIKESVSSTDFIVYVSPKTDKPIEIEEGKWEYRHDPSKFIFTNNPQNPNISKNNEGENPKPGDRLQALGNESLTILVQENTVIRLVFRTTFGEYVKENVKFFDYDITDGYIYDESTSTARHTSEQKNWDQSTSAYYASTGKEGINSDSNVAGDTGARYAFGNDNSGTGLGGVIWNQQKINKANDVQDGDVVGKASFGLVSGLHTETTANWEKGTLQWTDGIAAPAIFDSSKDSVDPQKPNYVKGKTNYVDDEFRLIFSRQGGTYSLNRVEYKNPTQGTYETVEQASNLESFTSRPTWDEKGILWTNNFWPMDKAPSWGTNYHDLKFGLKALANKRVFHGLDNNGVRTDGQLPTSDDEEDHNSYFGMTFHADFVVDPGYIAPLRYFFFGDDDLWVFKSEVVTDENGIERLENTELIADMGGVHPSIGEYVDLWDYIDPIEYFDATGAPNNSKKYRLTFYYTERGASGSTCYMRFSLPFESLVTEPPSHENKLRIEKNIESVDSAVDKLGEYDEFVFELHLFNENETEFVNRYPYKRYKKDGTEIETSHDYMFTNAEFYLKDGEYIIIDNLPAGMTYTVKELNEIRNEQTKEKRTYASTAFYTGTIEDGIDNNVRVEGKEVSGRVDDKAHIELPKMNYVAYVNALNPGVLTLKKQMTGDNIPVGEHSFKFNVTLTDSNGTPVPKLSWLKYVSEDNGKPDSPMKKQEDIESSSGQYVFDLEAGEKIMLYNLPVGTKYTIKEEPDEHFPLNKVEVNGNRITSNNNTIEGSIADNSTRVDVVYTNTAEVSIEKSQAKVVDGEENRFTTDVLTVEEGNKVAYRLTVKNNSKVSVQNLTVEDKIPLDNKNGNRLILVQDTITGNGSLQNDGETILWTIEEIESGGYVNLEFQVEVPEVSESQSWKNIAVLKEPDRPDVPDEPSNPVYIAPKLEIKKDQSRNGGTRTTDILGVNPGDEVTYYITVKNNSEGDAKDVTVTDEIPLSDKPEGENKYRLENAVSIKGKILETDKVFGGRQEGDTIKWDLFDLAAGQTAELEFTVTVPENGYHWKNVGYVSYTPDVEQDPNDPDAPKPGPTSPEPTNEVEIEKGIVIKKAQKLNDEGNFESNPLVVKEGSIVTYQITVQNDRDATVRNLVIEDEIPLDDIGANRLKLVEGSINAGGTLDSDGKTIRWLISELEPQKDVKLEFKVEVEKIGESQSWKNIAILKEPDKPDKPSNPVYDVPGLVISKDQSRNGGDRTTDTLTVKAGDKVTYYITVSNNGKGDANDVTVTDEIPLNILPADDKNHRLGPVEEGSIKGTVNGTDQNFGGSQDDTVIKWDKFNLKAGQTATLQFTVSVPEKGFHWKNVGYVSYTPDIKPDPDDPNPPKPEPTKPEPTNIVEIEKPEISIRKTQYVGDNTAGETDKLLNVKPGDVITYCLTVSNGSDKDATDVIVTDQIPDGLTLVNGSISDGGTMGSNNTITWKFVTLGAHNSKKLQFKAIVPQVDQAAKWTNIAYVTSGNPDPDPEEDPKTPSNEVEAIPGIIIEKTQRLNGKGEPTKDLLHVKKDDQVTYYLTVTNISDATAFDVYVKDTVPTDDAGNELKLIEDSVKGGTSHTVANNKRDITWKLGNLKAGESRTVEFTVIVPAGGTHWINGASTNYIPPDPENPDEPGPEDDRTPDIPSNEVEIEKPEINIRKTQYIGNNAAGETDQQLNVKPGDVITYCLTVSNGSDKDATDVIVTDQIPEGLTLVNGSISDGGTMGSNNTITWKFVTLGAHNSKKLQFKTTVPQVDQAAKWTNIAYVTSGNPDPDPEKDPKTPSNEVEAIPGIIIEKTQQLNGKGEPTKDLLHVKKDDQVTYYLTVTNVSDATAFDVVVKDTVPTDNAGNELKLVENSVKGGTSHTVANNDRDITWKLGNLKAGESRTVEFTVIVPAGGTHWINGASTNYIPPDPENPDNPGPEEDRTPDIPSNEVEIEKPEINIQKTQYIGNNAAGETKDLLSVKPGDVITYCLTVSNGSDKDATDVIVTDQIPEGLTLVNGSISDGGVLGSDDVITWKLGTLKAQGSKKVQFKATVPQVDKAAKWTNIAYVTSGNPDPDPEEDPKTPSNPVEAIPSITIEKTQQLNGKGEPTKDLLHVKRDDEVTYYLTVTNTSDATAFDVVVKDTVPTDNAGNELKLIEDSVKGGTSHTVANNKRDITWELGDLKAGESRTVEFTVIVPAGGTHWINGASTNYIPPDPENPDKPGPEEDRTPDIPSNEVEIEKPEINIQKTQYIGNNAAGETKDLLSVKPGDVITYCLTVSNGSDKDATDVIVTDQIPDGLTLVNGSISDGGTVGRDQIITWKLGTLKAHDSKKVQFKATVPQVDQAARWTNIAYVTSGNPDPDPEEDPKTPSNEVEAIPGITIEKTQQRNGEGKPTKNLLHVKKDDQVTYYLTVTNTSDATAFDVDVKDTVPTDDAGNELGLLADSVKGGESHEISGREITWHLGDLAPGASEVVEFTVVVPAEGTHWINGASTSYIPPDPEDPGKPGPEEDRTPDIPSNEVEIDKPEIKIRKTQYVGDNADQATVDLLSVKPGDVITYSLTVTNESDTEATDVIVTDQIPEGLTLVNGSVSDGGTVGRDGIITWNLGTIGAHGEKRVTFKVTVPQTDQSARWRNIAYVTSGNPDPDPEEDPKTPSNEVEAIPGITIEKTQQRNGEGEPTKNLLHVKADDRVTYYLTVINTSDATAFDVMVKDTIPTDNAGNELQLVADSVKGGTGHEINGREITWTLGDLKAGEKQTVEFTVTVPAGGTHWINGASTNYIPPDPEDPEKPSPDPERTPDIPSNEVEIDKSDANVAVRKLQSLNGGEATLKVLNVKPGDVITYRLVVSNESENPVDDVIVTDPVPEGLLLDEGSIVPEGTIETSQNGQQTITWKLGTLQAGEEKTLEFKVTVPKAEKAARWTNIAYVTEGDPNPDPEEDPKTPSNEVEAVPGIAIEKEQQVNGQGEPTKETLHVQKGDQVTYYLTVTNISEAKAFDVIVKDQIPEDSAGNQLELVEGSVEGGESHTVSGRVITWNVGDLEAGQSQTLKFTVKVPSDGSRWKNIATTSYVPGDPDDPENPDPENPGPERPNPDDPEPERTPDIPSNEVEIEAGTTSIQLRARKVLNGANLINGQFTFRIQGISAEIVEEAENEAERSETSQKPEEAGEATPSNAERQESETEDSGGESGGLLRIGGKTVTSKVLFQARALVKGDEMSVGNHTVPMPAVNTATNNEDGEILFGEIEYSLPGTYTYKITEVRENRRGYTFDTTEYIVEVLVTRDDATGELRAQVQIVKPEGADEILFTNRYRRSGGGGGGNPGGGGGGDPQPGPGTDPTPENPDTPNPDPTPENPENPQPTPDTPASVLPDPNDPNSPPTVTIEENGVPRTYVKVWDPVNEEFIYIPEEDVPLFGLLPKTGEEDRRRWLGVLLALSLAGIGTLTMEERRRKKKE